MRAVLAPYGDETRCVWLADSFAGVPRPDTAKYKADKWIRLDRFAPILAVPETPSQPHAAFHAHHGLSDRQ
jgi:O-methyltransferase